MAAGSSIGLCPSSSKVSHAQAAGGTQGGTDGGGDLGGGGTLGADGGGHDGGAGIVGLSATVGEAGAAGGPAQTRLTAWVSAQLSPSQARQSSDRTSSGHRTLTLNDST
eukprot:1315646-Prymnesium_polylepis.1